MSNAMRRTQKRMRSAWRMLEDSGEGADKAVDKPAGDMVPLTKRMKKTGEPVGISETVVSIENAKTSAPVDAAKTGVAAVKTQGAEAMDNTVIYEDVVEVRDDTGAENRNRYAAEFAAKTEMHMQEYEVKQAAATPVIDYDRIAEAASKRPLVVYVDKKAAATLLSGELETAIGNRGIRQMVSLGG